MLYNFLTSLIVIDNLLSVDSSETKIAEGNLFFRGHYTVEDVAIKVLGIEIFMQIYNLKSGILI